jgi:glycosyltransferase involved in cell wall biosynthesis
VPDAVKIMHVASGDLWAGAEAQIFQMVRQMARDGAVSVEVVLLNDGELARRLRFIGVTVFVLDESRLGAPAIFVKLVRLLRQNRPDVVHTHRTKENILGAIAARLAGVPASVRTVHGRPEHDAKRSLVRRAVQYLDSWVARRLQQRVIAVSAELRSFLQRSLVADYETIENGIDEQLLRAECGAVAAPFEESPGKRICFVGRLVGVKRIDIFLRMAQRLIQLDPAAGLRFYIIGDGPLRGELVQLAQQLGLERHCEFMGFREDCSALLRHMDILVLTSDHEGLPMTALESLALGVPVLASAVGGLVGLLDEERRGVLVDSRDPASFAESARRMYSAVRPRAGRESLLPFQYTSAASANAYLKVYRSLLPA